MFIDPRVAHGRTQYDLASTRRMFSARPGVFTAFTKFRLQCADKPNED
jgi:hypothetical protein